MLSDLKNPIYYYLKNVCTTLQGGFYDFRRDKISTIPISTKFSDYEDFLHERRKLMALKIKDYYFSL